MSEEIRKKQRERYVLEKFISSLKMPFYEIEENETPDFFLKLLSEEKDDLKIGIELTDLINPKLKKKEVILDTLIEYSRLLFKKVYPNANLRVFIDFELHNHPSKKSEIIELSQLLFKLISDVYEKNRNSDFQIRIKQNIPIECIRSISISSKENFENWQSFGAYQVPRVDLTWLTEKIESKNRLISKYKKEADQNWLVLVSQYGRKSSSLDFVNLSIQTKQYRFDKIYIFEYMSQNIHVVK